MKRVVVFRIALKLLLTGVFLSAFIVQRAIASSTVVSVYPTMSSRPLGEDFTITITIVGVRNLYGWSMELTWNPAILNVTETTEGSFMRNFGPETYLSTMINNTAGCLRTGSTFSHPVPPSGANGDGALAYVTFMAESSGQTILHLSTVLITAEGNNIWHQTRDGFFDNRLLTTYSELLDDSSLLLSNYTSLQEDYKMIADELGVTRSISYLLIITTVAFIATTVYFAQRKPKLKDA